MKLRMLGVLAFASFLIGCSTTGVPYSFAENESDSVSIAFSGGNPGVSLVYFDNNELPPPAPKSHWAPISFPAGQPLDIAVHVYYEQSSINNSGLLVSLVTSVISASRSVNRDVLFTCPALEAGNSYKLVYRQGGAASKSTLVLTDVKTGTVIYKQEFESK